MTAKTLWDITKQTFKDFSKDNALRLAAALAYYAMFSLGPMLYIILVIAGAIFGHETVRHFLHQEIASVMGAKAGATVDSMMEARKISGSAVTTIIGIVTLVFGALGVFVELQDSLNTVWQVKPKPSTGIWLMLRNRLLSLAVILGLGFLLLVSMVLTTLAEATATSVSGLFPVPNFVVGVLSGLASFITVAIFFALLFKYLPDAKVHWRPVLIGAVTTAVLFTGGKYLLSLYLGTQATTSSYGATGSVVVILLWVYYASLIMFVGAEFTQVYARRTGSVVRPDEYAVRTNKYANGMPNEPDDKEKERPPAPVGNERIPIAVMVALIIGLGAALGFRRHR